MDRRSFISKAAIGGAGILSFPALAHTGDTVDKDKIKNVLRYVRNNWDKTIIADKPGKGFLGVDIPYPYSSPSIIGEGHFTFFFYWDTYFTNLGLMLHGRADQVKNNIKNILWFIEEQGFMPNHVGLHNRSQPPYLQLMVSHYQDQVRNTDESFSKACAEGLRKEYQFWMTARYNAIGLNSYGHQEKGVDSAKFYEDVMERIKLKNNSSLTEEQKIVQGAHYLAEAESGWDFNQRFNGRCMDYAPVDLNALLFGYEEFLAKAAQKYNWFFKDLYAKRASERSKLINQYCWNEEKGWYFDYDFVNKKQSSTYSLAGMQPFFMGIASQKQAAKMIKNLQHFERNFGLAVAKEETGSRNYQWAYPVVWPPMVYISVMGLKRYGYEKDAKRIALKYLEVNATLFDKNGKLFEKTDAETGKIANVEYGSAPLMDWTAGVFVAFADFLGIQGD
jgi:alpha,alpha-trehalase